MFEFLLFIIIAIIILDIASVLLGADSRDGYESPEWLRRQEWPGFH
jgi:hypothetical protein